MNALALKATQAKVRSLLRSLLLHALYKFAMKCHMHHQWCSFGSPRISISMALSMPWCRPDMIHTSLSRSITLFLTILMNHSQLSWCSEGTKAKGHNQYLVIWVLHCYHDCALVYVSQECVIYRQNQPTMLKGRDALPESPEGMTEHSTSSSTRWHMSRFL